MTRRVIVLLVEGERADECMRALDGAIQIGGDEIEVQLPPAAIRGAGFLSNPEAPAWWREHELDGCEAVVVIAHTPRLPSALRGVSTPWIVWCDGDDVASLYAQEERVSAVVADDAEVFTGTVIARLNALGWNFGERPAWGPFSRGETRAASSPAGFVPAQPSSIPPVDVVSATVPENAGDDEGRTETPWRGQGPSLPELTAPQADAQVTPSEPLPSYSDPWSGQSSPSQLPEPVAAAAPLPPLEWSPDPGALVPFNGSILSPAGDDADPSGLVDLSVVGAGGRRDDSVARRRWKVPRFIADLLGVGEDSTPVDVAAIGHALIAFHDTVVIVGSRKGGVGKTTISLAMGFLAARAVEAFNHEVLVVDANLTNADIAVKLRLQEGSPTVRDYVTALSANATRPEPVTVAGSKMRVLGENRETERYSGLEIESMVVDFRQCYTLTIGDMANAAPGLEDKSEAAMEGWMPHADVVIIPIDTSTASLEGAGDMMAAINDLRQRRGRDDIPGVVVAFLRPDDVDPRKVAPELAAILDDLTEVGAQVVDIPSTSRMAMVDWNPDQVPLVDADPKVTRAYWRLLAAVIAARGERA